MAVMDTAMHVGPGPDAEGGAAAPARRILVAEDDSVSRNTLESLLSGRGHHVDCVADGEAAMAALSAHTYDVVLVDFHLPKMDGLAVASAYRSGRAGAPAPRFIAISADMKGLLEHAASCESFDEVVAKPFDLEDVLKVVEDAGGEADAAAALPPPIASPVAPIAHEVPVPIARHHDTARGAEFEFLSWPEDFDGDRLSARALRASLGDGTFHAVLVSKAATVADMRGIWSAKFLHALPVIDRGGGLGRAADFNGSQFGYRDREQIADLIRIFQNRRSLLHPDFLYTEDLGEKLLARIFLSGGKLEAAHNPGAKRFVDYNCTLDCDVIEREAARLVEAGFLKRTFFDRLHVCDRCGSSRFNIREECSECRSPHLTEEPYLHHFKCAYQGLESDFRQDDALICPKCRQELTHFSVDYDKPGTMIECQACGHRGSDPAVGLLCLECGAHTDGDRASTADIWSYDLTDRAIALLEAGPDTFGTSHKPIHFAELPLEIVVSINAELAKYKSRGVPFTLIDISYRNARTLEIEFGAQQFEQARNLFLENLRNVLTNRDRVVKGRFTDFALLTETEFGQVRMQLDEIRDEAMNAVRLDLGVAMAAYGAEQFA